LRILLLAPHPFFQNRGTPLAERALVEVLGTAGHAVDFLTFHEGEDIALPGCRIHRIASPPGVRNIGPGFSGKKVICDLFLLWSAIRLLSTRHYDLVHAVEEGALIAALLRPVFRVPYVYDMDSSLPEQMLERYRSLRAVAPAMEFAQRQAIRGSAGVLAMCQAVEDIARRHTNGQPVARVEDTTLLATDQEAVAALPPGRPVVMYVGNLEPYQGIDLLLGAFATAARAFADARLVIVGGSPEHADGYQRAADRLGIGSRVTWVGIQPVNRLAGYLSQADVLVSPRLTGRNTPMKIYSYLDSGRAVLATRIPTHTQVLDDEVACLAEPTPQAMGEALIALLRDPARREALARRARERVQAHYTPAVARTKLLAFFDAVETSLRQRAAAV
jgi:glycosyltransferase involved in cell wall biosynthesis